VIGNTSDTTYSSPHGAYWITYTDGVEIRDNRQPVRIGTLGIETTGSTGVEASNNFFPER
jgi:hypothetical protein